MPSAMDNEYIYIYIYISALNKTYKTNIAEEHSYRPAIQKLIESVDENISTINEPKPENKRIRPDILVKNAEHYIGFVETKDIGKNLNDRIYKEQFTKYKNAFPNLIITDYLHFILYINGEEKQNVRIGEVVNGEIQIIKENVEKFNNLLNTFISYTYNKPIKSVDELVKEMATKTTKAAPKAAKTKKKDEKKIKNAWLKYNASQLKELESLNDEYIDFISECKTERECTDKIVEMAKKLGYKDINSVKKAKAGDKLYAVNKGKAIVLFLVGSEPLEKGMKILGAHIDSPRLDIKQNPLYEDTELALLDTHYYGGIKKYQWVALPMAIHGVV